LQEYEAKKNSYLCLKKDEKEERKRGRESKDDRKSPPAGEEGAPHGGVTGALQGINPATQLESSDLISLTHRQRLRRLL
jgi:hypothetical protein